MEPILVTLDRPRAIRWTHRAEARIGSLERPVTLRDIAHRNPRRAYYALLCHVWAALTEPHDFAQPEDIGAHLLPTDDAQMLAAFTALRAALVEGGVIEAEKKSTPNVTQTGAPNGHSASLNLAPAVPTTPS
jgi:hypothetical protein